MNQPSFPAAGPDDPADAERLVEAAGDLVDVVRDVVPGWIVRLISDRVAASGRTMDDTVRREAARVGETAASETVTALRALLERDVDAQASNPLAVLRHATRHAHRVLAAMDMPPVQRDSFSRRAFPDDVYDLVPATWTDVDPALAEPGLTWSAAKAYIFKARRRREGRT